MDKEFGKKVLVTVINIKVNTQMIKNQDMVFLHGPLETFIKDTIKVIKDMDMDKCIGTMEVIIKENGTRVFKMDKVNFSI